MMRGSYETRRGSMREDLLRNKVAPSALLIVLALLATPAQARPKVVYAASELPPWKVYQGKDVIGVDVIILEKILDRLGYALEVQQAPLARCLAWMESGKADVISAVSASEEREKFIIFPPTKFHGRITKTFFTHRSSDVKIAKYEDLRNYTIGVKNGASVFEPFSSDDGIRKYTVPDDETGLRMLEHRRFDSYVTNDSTGEYLVRKLGFSHITKASFGYSEPESGQLGISKRSVLASRVGEIDRILKDMVDSGEVTRILEQFLGSVTPDRAE